MTLDEEVKAKVDYFCSLWNNQRQTLSVNKKDKIGKAYLKHIIGVNETTIQEFMEGSFKAGRTIGLRQGGVEPMKGDHTNFWQEINRITPNTYSHSNLAWLIENADFSGAGRMLFNIDSILREDSRVIREINLNAHTYK